MSVVPVVCVRNGVGQEELVIEGTWARTGNGEEGERREGGGRRAMFILWLGRRTEDGDYTRKDEPQLEGHGMADGALPVLVGHR